MDNLDDYYLIHETYKMNEAEKEPGKMAFKRRLIHSRRLRMLFVGVPVLLLMVAARRYCDESQFTYFLLFFFGAIIMFLMFNFRKSDEANIKITEQNEEINKQKRLIEEQKILVDKAFEELREKNKEVMDSIHYAKRIQTALLTGEKYIGRVLKKLNE